MMQQEYIFKLNGVECEPIYGNDLSLVYERTTDEMFFRQKLEGELVFVNKDYAYIKSQPYDTEFTLNIEYKGNPYYTGVFDRLSCKEDKDNRMISVDLENIDAYTTILSKYDKTEDILKLSPSLANIKIDKRPVLQVLVRGSQTLSCFQGGTKWDLPVTSIEIPHTELIDKYAFAESNTLYHIRIKSSGYIPSDMHGDYVGVSAIAGAGRAYKSDGSTKYHIRVSARMKHPVQTSRMCREIQIFDSSGAVSDKTYSFEDAYYLNETKIFIGGIMINSSFVVKLFACYARYNTSVSSVEGLTAKRLPLEDIATYNANMPFGIGYALDTTNISVTKSVEPTEYGQDGEGKYFVQPYSIYGDYFYSLGMDVWYTASLWFYFNPVDWLIEQKWREEYTLRDAYNLHSVIDILLKQIDPKYSFSKSDSTFLYGGTSLKPSNTEVFITQKTNILKGRYDQAAQKATTSLKDILTMLRDVFNCFWTLQGNRLKIEHISYFLAGGTYTGAPVVGVDLTTDFHNKHSKPYTFQTNSFEFDKTEAYSSKELSWSDKVSVAFDLKPIEVISNLSKNAKVVKTTIGAFNPDVDYMLAQPANIPQDGFALLLANSITSGSLYKLPYLQYNLDGIDYLTQNGYLTLWSLAKTLHNHNIPFGELKIDGLYENIQSFMKLKKQQLWYSDTIDPDVTRLVQTEEGAGQILRASINLTSRRIDLDLRYDTY